MSDANWYGEVFKAWPVKLLGAKPTADMLASIHNLGARPGKQALASAMALRTEGVTGAQIQIACGAPQLNKMRGFITDALLKRVPASPGPTGHQVYKLELTAKGKARIERTLKAAEKAAEAGNGAAEAKPAKAKKAVSKPRKAKAEAVTDTAPAETGQTENQPQA